jgi:hypothetical protein
MRAFLKCVREIKLWHASFDAGCLVSDSRFPQMKGRINDYQILTQPPRAGEELGGAKAYATCQKYEGTRELTLGINPRNHDCVSNFVVDAEGAALEG